MSDTAAAENVGTEIPGEAEVRAREMGWRPKEEWVGDDSGWVDADAFIEKQESRAQAAALTENKELKAQVASLTREQSEMRRTLAEFKDHHSKVEQRAYARALTDIQAKQRQAVEAGDTEAFDAAAQEANALLKDAASTAPPGTAPRAENPDEIPAYKAWHEKNPWYNTDLRLTKEANQLAPEITRIYGLTPEQPEFYEKITASLKAEFPEKFENKNRKRPNAVEEGGGAGGGKKKGKTAADLPPEAKEAGARFVKQELFKNLDEYAKEYFAEEE